MSLNFFVESRSNLRFVAIGLLFSTNNNRLFYQLDVMISKTDPNYFTGNKLMLLINSTCIMQRASLGVPSSARKLSVTSLLTELYLLVIYNY